MLFLLLVPGLGCRTRSPATGTGLPGLPPVGRVVHSDAEQGYAVVDFDMLPVPGQILRLVDAYRVTASVRVTGRSRGSCVIVEIIDGQPKPGDHVAVAENREE